MEIRLRGAVCDPQLENDLGEMMMAFWFSMLSQFWIGVGTEVTPKFVSPSDPAARWTGAHGGQAFFACSTNYLVDVENAIIVHVEATTAIRQVNIGAAIFGAVKPSPGTYENVWSCFADRLLGLIRIPIHQPGPP
jgi:hypothetical protein